MWLIVLKITPSQIPLGRYENRATKNLISSSSHVQAKYNFVTIKLALIQ
jgi:hypothetical protein